MKIPKKIIKIGGRPIEIKRFMSSDMDSLSGSWSNWQGVIRLANDPDLDPSQKYVSLIHEIIECLNDKYQYLY